jgi:CheY-like chemotaxis protein
MQFPPENIFMLPCVLLVDDGDCFMELVTIAFARSGLQATLQYVPDGEEAMLYLSRTGKFADETAYPTPALVLLDLKMPRVDGFAVLQWKHQQPALRGIPFVALSSSNLQRDKERAMQSGGHSYFVKPMDLRTLIDLVRDLDKFFQREESRVK